MSVPVLDRLPVTVITGFLGSGKTTLINHLLSTERLGRVAALVNDFGAIDIDGAVVAQVADEVVQLSNGCICCTINGDLRRAALRVLALQPPVDRIVVETSGIADPLPVGLTFLQTELKAQCVLEAVVTVVDCANFSLDLFRADVAMAQIVHADVIVLNKIDMVQDATVAAVRDKVSLIKPQAIQLTATRARVPWAAIASGGDEPSIEHLSREGMSRTLTGDHVDGFAFHAARFSGQISSRRFQDWLEEGWPASVFRAKGILEFDSPGRRFLFQFCGGRASFEPFAGAMVDNRIVFIGQGFDAADLDRRTAECLL